MADPKKQVDAPEAGSPADRLTGAEAQSNAEATTAASSPDHSAPDHSSPNHSSPNQSSPNQSSPNQSAPPHTRRRSKAMLSGPVGKTLLDLTAPMVVGMAAVFLFMTVDTYFVGQLGVAPLAALGFCMPVTLVVISGSVGLGIGTTAVIGRAIGAGNIKQARRLTTDALLLGAVLACCLSPIGLLSITPLFEAMGASSETLVLIRQYMVPWLAGVGLLIVPMQGNSAIRATGDTKTPMVIMMVSGFVNIALDPLLIFGVGPLPGLGIQGAAWATVLSWSATFAAGLWVLHHREKLLTFRRVALRQLTASWKRIAAIGGPAAGANVLVPASVALITGLISSFSEHSVAAFGVGRRIEMLATVGGHALAIALTPFAAQNLGARQYARIRDAHRFAGKASLVWGIGMALILVLSAPFLAGLFSNEPLVIDSASNFLRIIPWSYGMLGAGMATASLFNALGLPFRAVVVVASSSFGVGVPLAYLGGHLWGLEGIFVGVCVANTLVGFSAWFVTQRWLARCVRLGGIIGSH